MRQLGERVGPEALEGGRGVAVPVEDGLDYEANAADPREFELFLESTEAAVANLLETATASAVRFSRKKKSSQGSGR